MVRCYCLVRIEILKYEFWPFLQNPEKKRKTAITFAYDVEKMRLICQKKLEKKRNPIPPGFTRWGFLRSSKFQREKKLFQNEKIKKIKKIIFFFWICWVFGFFEVFWIFWDFLTFLNFFDFFEIFDFFWIIWTFCTNFWIFWIFWNIYIHITHINYTHIYRHTQGLKGLKWYYYQ